MKEFFVKFRVFFALLFFILLLSWLRSYIDRVPYINAFDMIISTLLANIWKLISNTTIFVALLCLIVAWRYRRIIFSLLNRIESFQIGKAQFDLAETVFYEFLQDDAEFEEDDSKIVFLKKYIDGMSKELAWRFLKAHNKSFTMDTLYLFNDSGVKQNHTPTPSSG